MLKSLAEAVDNRVIDTETFIKSFERMTGLSLTTFADQFIYGTGVPEIYYTYEFVPQSDGSWMVEGQARQMSPGQFRYRLEMTESETWHVARERVQSQDASSSVFLVPFQVSLADPKDVVEERQAWSRNVTTTERGLGGRMVIQGEVSDFQIALPEEPKSFWLDQRGEVLARFYCEAREPKRMLRYQAHELAGSGAFAEAEAMYLKALSAPLFGEGTPDELLPKKRELERQTRRQDALIHIGMARLYVEQQRDEDARRALDTADGMLKGLDRDYFKMSRVVLRAHMDVHAGEYRAAYETLSKILRLDFPVVEGETVADSSRRNRFKTGRRYRGSGRAYALLAVTAFETGHDVVARQALKEAEKRGADMEAAKRTYGSDAG
jgi:tetratricopeptide (TPR) repeat protein